MERAGLLEALSVYIPRPFALPPFVPCAIYPYTALNQIK